MSQNKLAKLRNTDVFKALMRVLEGYRIPKEDYDVLDKRPHPVLTVRYCGIQREMFIPSTPKTKGKAPVAYAAQLRRLLKEMQMDALTVSVGGKPIQHEVTTVQEQPSLPLFPAKRFPGSELTMSSREIADLVKSRHDDVKRSIKRLADRGVIAHPPMADVQEMGGNNRSYITQEYRIGKRDSYVIVAQLSPEFTAALVDRWQELEEQVRRPPVDLNDPAWLRGQLLTYTERVMSLEATVASQAPKVEALERIAEADGSLCVTDAAKNLQVQPQRLFKWMDTNGWTYIRPGTSTRLAYQTRLNAGYLEHKITTKPKDDGSERVSTQVRVTPKGIAHLAEIFPTIALGGACRRSSSLSSH